jgi:acetyl esterase/lipase
VIAWVNHINAFFTFCPYSIGMKKVLLAILFCSIYVLGYSQHLVSATFIDQTQPTTFSLFTPQAIYAVKAYKITYHTTNVDGTPTVASGLVVVPEGTSCDSLPMAVYNHGTVLLKNDVPSRNNSEALITKVVASTGAIAVAPDYLGLGDNPGLHPYLHAQTEATATIDLMRAAREFSGDSLQIYFNTETFVTGYSQGGHAAMATTRYIQDSGLTSEFNLIGAGPASGPYYLSGSQAKVLVSNQPYSNPGYVCYLLFAMNRVYGDIYQAYADILKAPYDTLIPPYFDGNYDMSVVNALLPDTLSGFLQDSVLANFRNDSVSKTHPIWRALIAQDNYNWKPSFPMELYYCTQDEQVNYQNSIDAAMTMTANGANVSAVNKGAYNHGGCVVPSLQGALGFFISQRSNCNIGLIENKAVDKLQVYPNPVKDWFTLSGFEDLISLRVFNSEGQLILEKELNAQEPINTRAWSAGVYTIEITQNQNKVYRKLTVM